MRQYVPAILGSVKHALCVLVCITYPRSFIVMVMHIINTLFRLVLLSTGLAWFVIIGYDDAPGLGYSLFTPADMEDDKHVGGWHYSGPVFATGTIVLPYVWSMILIVLSITDMVRLQHMVAGHWSSHTNHVDVTWRVVTVIVIPPLIACTAMQLGVDDVCMICIVLLFAWLAGFCEMLGEDLFLLHTKELYEGWEKFHTSVVSAVCCMYTTMICTALSLATFPILFKVIHSNGSIPNLQMILMFLLFILVILLVVVQLSNYCLYTMLRKTRSDRCGLLPPMRCKRSICNLKTTHWFVHTSTEVGDVLDRTNHQTAQKTEAEIDPFNVETSERMFNEIYGCRVYSEYSVDADIKDSHCQVTYTDSDGDGNGTQYMVGMLVEWRRFYPISMIINSILVCSLMQMTGLLSNT